MSNDSDNKLNKYGVLILSDRDRKEFDYILNVRGEQWVKYAIKNLIGNRRPYVSNIAKIAMLEIPNNLPDKEKVIPIEDGLKMLEKALNK